MDVEHDDRGRKSLKRHGYARHNSWAAYPRQRGKEYKVSKTQQIQRIKKPKDEP